MTNNEKNMTENVLERIRAKSVHMRPRAYFTLRIAAVVLVGILALVFSIFLFNLVLFILFTGGRAHFLLRGTHGLLIFVQHFPWWVLVADILLLALLRSLLRQFSFGYRSPALYMLFGLLVVVGAFGFIIYRSTDVNERIEHEAHFGHLPSPVGDFYDDARRVPLDPDDLLTAPDGATSTQE